MKRAIILPALVTAFVALSPAGVALADNPHDGTTGQPNKTETVAPPGHSSDGFANAEAHYAEASTRRQPTTPTARTP